MQRGVVMNIQEMKEKKKEMGYTNEQIAELSGVPLGTVQKIFGGATTSPRYDTLNALEKIFLPEKRENHYTSVLKDGFLSFRKIFLSQRSSSRPSAPSSAQSAV